MGTKSAFLLPGGYWPIEEPSTQDQVIPLEAFFEENGVWRLACGVSVSTRRGGVVVFDFSGYPSALMTVNDGPEYFSALIAATQTRVKLINAFSLCLHSSRLINENLGTDGFQIDHQDLFHLSGDDVAAGMGGNGLSKLPTAVRGGFLRDFYRHGVLPKISLDLACETFDFLATHEKDKALDLAALLNSSLTAFGNHDFPSSLITAWTVCETLLQGHWMSYMTEKGANSSRRQKLAGRDFTASVVSEILELAQVIDSDTLGSLDRARKARNAWMHNIKAPDFQEARDGIEIAASMLSQTLGREIRVGAGVGATGL